MTRNRRQWLPQAIQCYRQQTYPNRELLIVADGEDVRDLIPPADDIRLIHLADYMEIGGKRNFGCQEATGEVIAHWDDDDFSASGRLDDQIPRLVESGRAVTGYRSMLFHGAMESWMYCGAENFAVGTSLVFWRDWWVGHPFRAVQVGEDNEFVAEAAGAGQLSVADAGDLMHATIHIHNTSPRTLSGPSWRRIA